MKQQGAGPERRRYVVTDDGIGDVERWLAEPAPLEPDLCWMDHTAARLDMLRQEVGR